MTPSHRSKFVGIVLGVLLAGVPAGLFHYWVGRYIDREGQEEVANIARRSIWLADRRLDRVVAGLATLASRNADLCGPSYIQAMRETAFAITPMKEISVIAPDGRAMCTDVGVSLGERRIISPPTVTQSGVVLEVVRVVDRAEPMVRVRHKIGDDGTALAALVPGDLLIPQAAVRRSLNAAYARVTSRDGTLIAEAGARITDDDTGKERIVTHQQSGPFGLVATVSISSA